MVLFYSRINWENFPSVNTALNAINLNAMDYAVKTLDERTVELDTVKANQSVVLNTIQDWSMDEETGIITITKVNGEQIMFDLNIEKIPVKFELSEDGILSMTTEDGSAFTANIGSMIPVMTFESTDTISVKVVGEVKDKTYSFAVKDGSITEEKLQPNYLADIKVQAENASMSAESASASAKEAKGYAEQAKESSENVSEISSKLENIEETYATKAEVAPVNNLLATVSGKPLDATQGKVLDDKISAVSGSMGGFSFFTNPTVVYLLADNTPYKDSDGNYVLAESETGAGLLADAETYYSDVIEGDYRSVGGADSVTPFKSSGGSGSCGVEIYYLGEGTEFDIPTLLPDVDFASLTEENFIVGVSGASAATTASKAGSSSYSYLSTYDPLVTTKEYDTTTGILTLGGKQSLLRLSRIPSSASSATRPTTLASKVISNTLFAYLVIGEIKTI